MLDKKIGRFFGQGQGTGGGQGGQGSRQGTGGGSGPGLGGNCICPKCGAVVPHQRQVPCTSVKCPQCGSSMIRER